jgi:hypothetical protein
MIARRSSGIARVVVSGFLCLALTGCDPFLELRSLLGQRPAPVPSPTPAEKKNFDLAKGRREILAEMLRVVFDTSEVENDEFFEGLLSSLNQGASIEGIYRGLIQGQRYRSLETGATGADPAQIRFFAAELALLQESMKNPTRLDTKESRGVPTIEFPDGDTASAVTSGPESDVPLKKGELESRLTRDFIGASPYTLKRILGNEALKKIDELKESRADMAQWYAATVLRLVKRGVDFGVPLRNSDDFGMHLRFAETVSPDRVIWEVLNRYHRCINAIAKK